MATNPIPDPWAPDADHKPGEPGERGSSAFAGNAQFSAPGSGPNDGATRALGGEYGDAPTSYSDPTHAANRTIIQTPISDQANRDARAAERATAAAAALDTP